MWFPALRRMSGVYMTADRCDIFDIESRSLVHILTSQKAKCITQFAELGPHYVASICGSHTSLWNANFQNWICSGKYFIDG
jgi:hypothetical protein